MPSVRVSSRVRFCHRVETRTGYICMRMAARDANIVLCGLRRPHMVNRIAARARRCSCSRACVLSFVRIEQITVTVAILLVSALLLLQAIHHWLVTFSAAGRRRVMPPVVRCAYVTARARCPAVCAARGAALSRGICYARYLRYALMGRRIPTTTLVRAFNARGACALPCSRLVVAVTAVSTRGVRVHNLPDCCCGFLLYARIDDGCFCAPGVMFKNVDIT